MVGTKSLGLPEKVLLVEGQDDKHVVRHLCLRSQPPMPNFCTLDKGGIDKLLPAIAPEIKTSGRKVVGIVVDANDAMRARWNAVVDRLRKANITPPPDPNPTGTIIPGAPRIGIWLMPDNQSSGELEDFIQKMIPLCDPVWPMSEAYINGIPNAHRRFVAGKKLRAELYAWLATRKTPGRMGSAIGAADLDVKVQLGATFADWLRRLFG